MTGPLHRRVLGLLPLAAGLLLGAVAVQAGNLDRTGDPPGLAASDATGATDAPTRAPAAAGDGGRGALRELVRLGQLHVCVADRLLTEAGEPVLVLRNECDRRISVTICLREKPQAAPGFYTLLISPGQEARQPLGVPAGSAYSYRFNACRSDSCTAPRPEC